MIPLTLASVAEIVGGELADAGDAERQVEAVAADSREAAPGTLFVPLTGTRVDGHDFIVPAVAAGATGYLLRAGWPLPAAPGGIVVDDPLDALTGLAAWLRDTVAPVVVAVTGSNGKTTTKDLLAAALAAGRRVAATPASYNNELGVPLTCCLLQADTQVLVAEVGSRAVGHIASLTPLLRPDVAVVTGVAGAHLATFGDVAAVARAKGELVEGLQPGGLAVLNVDDPLVAGMARLAPGRVVTVGLTGGADWQATDIVTDDRARPAFTVAGHRVRLPMPGQHGILGALAALAVASACGVDLGAAVSALATARVSRWRMELHDAPDGTVVVNDAYNANPASVRAALRTLASMRTDGRRWAVLGEMAELGPGSGAAHAQAGDDAIDAGIGGLIAVGADAHAAYRAAAARAGPGVQVLAARDTDEAVRLLQARLGPGDIVLVKGSRVAGLERVAHALLAPSDERPLRADERDPQAAPAQEAGGGLR